MNIHKCDIDKECEVFNAYANGDSVKGRIVDIKTIANGQSFVFVKVRTNDGFNGMVFGYEQSNVRIIPDYEHQFVVGETYNTVTGNRRIEVLDRFRNRPNGSWIIQIRASWLPFDCWVKVLTNGIDEYIGKQDIVVCWGGKRNRGRK